MAELPPATVEHPRAHRMRAAGTLRKVLGVAIIVAAALVCWRMLKHWTRSESSKQLEVRQDKARARVGNGFDDLFERMLDKERSYIDLVVKLDVARGLSGYDAANCGWGFDAAFEEALGPDVLGVTTLGIDPDPRTQLELTGTITPSGTSFQLPRATKAYPGIVLRADVKFLGKQLHVDATPEGAIEFKHVRMQYSLEGISDSDVTGGILQAACKEVAYALVEQHTKWRRPPPPPRPDPLVECEQGFHCRENAELLEATDRPKAATLYDKACQNDDEAACVRLAELALESANDKNRAVAALTVEMACDRELPRACAALGRLRGDRKGEALLAYLRACDLGIAEACSEAAPLLAGTPFAEAAPVLAGKQVTSKKLGTIFALRWGQWTKWDRGQPTAWVTQQPPRAPDGAIVKPFTLDTLPAGITPPPGVETVYAIALEAGRGTAEDVCLRCNPSGGGDSIYRMRSFDCVCALAPKNTR